MPEAHPLVKALHSFMEVAKNHSNELKLVESLYPNLMTLVGATLSDEIGKEVMRMQFPLVSDADLLQMWNLTCGSENKRHTSYDGPVHRIVQAIEKSREDEERQRKTEAENARKRSQLKESADTKIEECVLDARIIKKLKNAGFTYLAELVLRGGERFNDVPLKEDALEAIRKMVPWDLKHQDLSWWSPPTEDPENPEEGTT